MTVTTSTTQRKKRKSLYNYHHSYKHGQNHGRRISIGSFSIFCSFSSMVLIITMLMLSILFVNANESNQSLLPPQTPPPPTIPPFPSSIDPNDVNTITDNIQQQQQQQQKQRLKKRLLPFNNNKKKISMPLKDKFHHAEPWILLRNDPNPIPSIEELEQSGEITLEDIDSILDRVQGQTSGMIIQGYRPEASWLWKQWFGTVLVHSAPTAIVNMIGAFLFCIICRYWIHGDFQIWNDIPLSSSKEKMNHPLLQRLIMIDKVWKTLMSLTTFLLTFFVGQAYTFWRGTHDLGRNMQGRFNDIHMLLATHATRIKPSSSITTTTTTNNNSQKALVVADTNTSTSRNSRQHLNWILKHIKQDDDEEKEEEEQIQQQPQHPNGRYTPEAYEFLTTMAQKLRVFHLLYWASNATRFRILLTKQGLDRMVERGIIPKDERDYLELLDLAPTQRFVACLESAIITCSEALRNPKIIANASCSSSFALEHILLDQFCRLRAAYGTIGDMVAGRMPLAYAHFVQILVDSFLLIAPLAQYAELGIFSVISIGILTIFYHGMLNLAKVFLDPLDNEDYCEGCVYLDLAVLIRESNSASTRWMRGVVAPPVPTTTTTKTTTTTTAAAALNSTTSMTSESKSTVMTSESTTTLPSSLLSSSSSPPPPPPLT